MVGRELRFRLARWLVGADNAAPGSDNQPYMSRPLTDADVDSFMEAAADREGVSFTELEEFLDQLHKEGHAIRVRYIRKDLKWLRGMAHKRDLTWGRRPS